MVSSGRISNMSYVRMYMYDVPCACMHDVQRAYSIEVYIFMAYRHGVSCECEP